MFTPLKKILSFLVLAIALPASAVAMTLSLDDCLSIALNENPTIKVADMEIKRVDYAKKEIRGQLFPQVDFAASYSRALAKQTVYFGGQSIKMGLDNSYNVGFSASIPLVVPTLWKSIKLNDNQVLQNIEAARSSRLSLVNQVKNAYYALLLAIDSKKVIEANHSTAQFHAKVFKRMFELGTASEYDMLRANVAVTNLEPSILEATNSIKQLKLQLKVLMGMDVAIDFEPSMTLEQFRATMYERTLSMDTSLVLNTNLKTLDLQTDYLKKVLEVQKMTWLPTVVGAVNYNWTSMSNGSVFRNFNWNAQSSAGISVSWTIWDNWQRRNKIKQAEISLREMDWQRDNMQRTLHTQVQTQIDNINKSVKQIESNTAGLRQAEKASQIMQESFKLGVGTFIQLRDTDDALMAAQLSYYQAIYNYLVAQSNLELVLGNAPLDAYATHSAHN